MKSLDRYTYLSTIFGLSKGSRSNISKKVHKKVPLTMSEEFFLLFGEKELLDIINFMQNPKGSILINVSKNYDSDESNTVIMPANEIIALAIIDNVLYQTFLPVEASVRVLFNTYYDNQVTEEEIELFEITDINDKRSYIDKTLQKKVKESFINREHINFKDNTLFKNSTLMETVKIKKTLDASFYLYHKYLIESYCLASFEYNKNDLDPKLHLDERVILLLERSYFLSGNLIMETFALDVPLIIFLAKRIFTDLTTHGYII